MIFVNYYNQKIRESKDTQSSEKLQEIELAIQDSIISIIQCTNRLSIEQGIALLGCQNKNLIELFIQQLLTEIKDKQNQFPELYSVLTVGIGKEATAVLSDDDKIQLSTTLVERMNTVHAPDIGLSCYMVHTLHVVLYKTIEAGFEHIYNKQKEKIEQVLRSLTNRLQVVKPQDVNEDALLANIQGAIKFSYHVLNKLKGVSSLDTRGCLYRIKIAGLLLLQALAVEAEWYGAVVSMGKQAPTALGATYSFISHLLRRGKQSYYCFSDNKEYFTTLIKWQESLETYLVAGNFEKAKTFLEKLKESKDLSKYWDNPHFILGAIKILLVTYELYPEVEHTIIGILIHYYKSNKEKQDALSQQIVKQISFTFLKLLEETSLSTPLLKSQLEAIKNNMGEEEKALYVSYQQSKEISKRNSQYNLAKEAWKRRYEDDVKLYEISLLISEKGSEALTKEQLTCLGKLRSGVSSNLLSSWKVALLSTFSQQELTQVAVKARLKAFISQSMFASEVGLSMQDIKSAAQDQTERSFILEIIELAIREGTANVDKIKVSDEQKAVLKTNFGNFLTAVFKATPATTTKLHRIMQPLFHSETIKNDMTQNHLS